jgi:uridine kinase
MDDFFLRPEQRTEARLLEIGGNVDRERFLSEVLLPHSHGQKVTYRPFDCSVQALGEPIAVEPRRLTIIEGAYAMHPTLAPHYDLSVFLDISPALQKKRIQKRNSPALAKRFFEEWIPMETRYFAGMSVKERCDLVIGVEEA